MADLKHAHEIINVLQTEYADAKFYGGCNVNGKKYIYDADRDALIREDVFIQRLREDKNYEKLKNFNWRQLTAISERGADRYVIIESSENLLELLIFDCRINKIISKPFADGRNAMEKCDELNRKWHERLELKKDV